MRNHEGDPISTRRPFCREARRHRQKGKRPRNRCRTRGSSRALRQQGSESLASNRPRAERPESPKRRDGASPSQSSCCNRNLNEAPPFTRDFHSSEALNLAEGVRRGMVAQHDERRGKAMRATRFRRAVFQRRGADGFSRVEGVGGSVAPRRRKEE